MLFTTVSGPSMVCPSLIGPVVVNKLQIEFYCDVNTTVTDPRARFNVTFLFDCERDVDVPTIVLTANNLRATLHERYLANRLRKTVNFAFSPFFISTQATK